MSRPQLLDLFCGAGGAAMGYHRAGFDVVGVDIKPQPGYQFGFVQADALEVLQFVNNESDDRWWSVLARHVDAIHASPPCQRYSDLAGRNGNADAHPDLIAPVRELLEQTGLPWVIENVEGAPLRDPVLACGMSFSLRCWSASDRQVYRLRRHRLFESNFSIEMPACACAMFDLPFMDVTGGGPSHKPRTDGKGGRTYKGTADEARRIMGIDWMTKAELNEAIPPAYTQAIGNQLLGRLLIEDMRGVRLATSRGANNPGAARVTEKGAEIRTAREELAGFSNTWFYSHEIDEIHAFAEAASEEECCAELDRLHNVRDLRLADWRAGQ